MFIYLFIYLLIYLFIRMFAYLSIDSASCCCAVKNDCYAFLGEIKSNFEQFLQILSMVKKI